ncbi:MAG: hypothetical protein ACKV2O_24320 [Acidimicrobiales bacterium]
MQPSRPLGAVGLALWQRLWATTEPDDVPPALIEIVQVVCEQTDESQALRVAVLKGGDWRDRVALRKLHDQILEALTLILDRLVPAHADDAADQWLRSLSAPLGDGP